MSTERWVVGGLAIAMAALLFVPASVQAQRRRGREVNIALIVDGPSQRDRDFHETFLREISDLLSYDFDVNFVGDGRIEADFTLEGIQENVERVLADPGVDLVLSGGPISSLYLASIEELPKPVVALFVMNADAQGMPYVDGTSGRRNLNYITYTLDLAGALEAFADVVSFERIGLLVSQGSYDAVSGFDEFLRPWFAEQGLDLQIVTFGSTAESGLSQLGPDLEAVVVGAMPQFTEAEFQLLVAGLIDRRLPSFSLIGESEVEDGLMVTTYRNTDLVRLARRTGLNIQRILEGTDAGTLPVNFSRDEGLIINIATARAVGVSPTWAVLTEAELVQQGRQAEEPLRMQEAIDRAVAANLDLLVETFSVQAAEETIGEDRAPLLPQIDVNLVGQMIDADRARLGFGQSPQYLGVIGASLTQLIYEDSRWARFEISERLALSEAEAREAFRLDIVAATANVYLDVLRALVTERVAQENLAWTRTNLELARVRLAVGYSGPSDVYRFESEIANNRREVINANAGRNVVEIRLQRLMNVHPEEAFSPVEPRVYEADPRIESPLRPYLDNPASFRLFRDFMVGESIANSPEIRQLDELILAQERAMTAADRAFYIPEISFLANIEYWLRAGSGSDFVFPNPPDDINWTLQLVATLPLYTGDGRRATQRVIEAELSRLRAQRDATALALEESMRQVLHLAGASAAGISLARESSAASDRNLELVQDAYARGVASIPELIDAQVNARVAAEEAANAVYNYLRDLTDVERALGQFQFELSPDERLEFYQRVADYFQARQQAP